MSGDIGVAVAERSRQIRYESTAREVPQIFRWFAGIVIGFDLVSALTGTTFPKSYYLSDLVQITGMLLISWVIGTHRAPARIAPWLFAVGLIISAGALSYQQRVEPEAMTMPIMMIGVLVVGGLAMFWGPFWMAGIPLVVITGLTASEVYPDHGDDWTIAAATGLAASAAMLISRKRSAQRLAAAQVEIEMLAIHDASTGLLNRRGFERSVPALVALAKRREEDLFVAFLDISGLKKVNDHFGHAVGDEVIHRVARALEIVSRDSDLVVRWGGDEFIVFGLGPAPEFDEYSKRICAAIDLSDLDGRWDGEIALGLVSSSATADVEALIRQADAQMYKSRRSG